MYVRLVLCAFCSSLEGLSADLHSVQSGKPISGDGKSSVNDVFTQLKRQFSVWESGRCPGFSTYLSFYRSASAVNCTCCSVAAGHSICFTAWPLLT
ncbi:hypothetical protein I79_007883 [Cricetulus griseus]|uniref:Secreted protein n=1 Tax=Cricetulus griseus TaxID=10029 RepID=G3HBT4_CRIGR|nr:hypothetical protein I79_007883 [Cricetulus griseus]